MMNQSAQQDDDVEPPSIMDVPMDIVVEYYIFVIGLPIVSVPGALCNMTSVFVFLHPRMRSPINLLLGSLSIVDSVLLVVACVLWASIGLCETETQMSACSFINDSARVLYPLALFLHFMSVWICVIISFERFLAIRFPLRAKGWITTQRTVISIAGTVAVSVLLNLSCFFELDHDEQGRLKQSDMKLSKHYKTVKVYGYFVMMFVVPFLLMIIFNSIVIISIRQAFKRQKNLRSLGSQVTQGVFDEKEKQVTIRATLVTVTFLIFNVMASIGNFLDEVQTISEGSSFAITRRICLMTGTFLVAVNSAVNCVVYYVIGRRFRTMFCHIFCPCCCRPRRNSDRNQEVTVDNSFSFRCSF
ncbi:MAG: G-protein coupled receptor, partial [Gammaproteobacteria bacterium]|nr:G-protein coupled receptor [Gammaproteobacteria bacterium]